MESTSAKISVAVAVSVAGFVCLLLLSLPLPRLIAAGGPVDPADAEPGIWYQYFEIEPDLESQTPVDSGVTENFDLSLAQRGADYALRFSGYLNVPAAGEYTLYVQADSDVRFVFDGVLLMTQVGGDINAPEMARAMPLEAGLYPFILEYVHGDAQLASLTVSWSGPTIGKRPIAPEELFYSPSFTAQLPPTATPTATGTVTATVPTPGTPGTNTPPPGTPTPIPLPDSRLANAHFLPAIVGGPGSDNPQNQPPQIALIEPQNNASYAAGEPITMTATASDDSAVVAVRFYADGEELTEDTTAPYSYAWEDATAGLHGIQARAFDDGGAMTASALVPIVVDDAPSDAPRVYFVTPSDGATVSSPVQVEMGADNFTIEPAGAITEGAGHFHIMIDVGCVAPGETIPMDDNHRHFGNGQTEVELELTPGEHALCLQAGNGIHTALDLTQEITITVEN